MSRQGRQGLRGLRAGSVTLLLSACAASVLAGLPQACRPQAEAARWLQQARESFDPAAPRTAEALWDAAMAHAAAPGVPSCRAVETAWQIGDFLKLHARTSSELALDYLNRGMAAHRPAATTEDLPLIKLLKTSAHFFARRGDRERACRSLDGALRVLERLPAAEVETLRAQITTERVQGRCSPSAGSEPDQNR